MRQVFPDGKLINLFNWFISAFVGKLNKKRTNNNDTKKRVGGDGSRYDLLVRIISDSMGGWASHFGQAARAFW
jgi:hypothetical protein